MLHLDIIRGPHSTGVAFVRQKGNWDLVKKKGTAWDLFDSKEFAKEFSYQAYALIGHNRYATKGRINNINAHPFEFENVVGAHNGTIRGQHRLTDNSKFEVDSENIFHSIQNEGLDETLSKLDGAYALSYWDNREECLVLLRNDERDLYYALTEDEKTLFWASEAWMIVVAADRNKVKLGDVKEVPLTTICRFFFDRSYAPKKTITASFEKFEEFIPPKATTTSSSPAWMGAGSRLSGYVPTPKKEIKTEKKEVTKGNLSLSPKDLVGKRLEFTVDGVSTKGSRNYISGSLVSAPSIEVQIYYEEDSPAWIDMLACSADTLFEGDMLVWSVKDRCLVVNYNTIQEVEDEEEDEEVFLIHGGKYVTESEWKKLTKKGCAWCADPADINEANSLVWFDGDEFVCPSCKSNEEVKHYLGEL